MTEETSPYAAVGPALVHAGYSAIPIRPDGKMPGIYARDEWFIMRGWSRYCGELPGSFQVAQWSRWPNAGVGVACGRGLIAFDIDRDDLLETIKGVLPLAVVAKRGRKGETLFYRGDTSKIRSRGFKIDKLGVMDLISDGKQTVVPPSIHPTTGEPYEWTTRRTLMDTPLAMLTEVDESHVEAVIEVLIDFGYDAKDQSHYFKEQLAGTIIDGDTLSTSEFFRTLNDDALVRLDAWVPRLGLSRLVRNGDGYRSVAEWRPSNSGNPIGKRPLLLSINPKGIVDYGDGDKGYTPLNLVMAAHDLADFQLDKAAVWLGEAIGYDFAPKMVLNQGRKPGHVKPQRPDTAIAAPVEREEDAEGVDVPEPEPEPADAPRSSVAEPIAFPRPFKAGPEPEAEPLFAPARAPAFGPSDDDFEVLTHVPGLVGDLVGWITATALVPNRTLALAASLTFVGTLAGRLYETETNLRTNLYTLGLAPSGYGKDHARRCIDTLITKAGLTRWLGGDGIASGSGMRKRVEQHPAIMWMLDEFGGFMREINNSKLPHMHQVRDYLLGYFGSASGTFRGKDYAGEQGTPCYNPNVGIYGASTPADFWSACRSLSVSDGLLPRILTFTVKGDELPDEVRPKMNRNDPPKGLMEACRAVASQRVGRNLSGMTSDGSTAVTPYRVPFGPGAEEDYYDLRREYRVKAHHAAAEEQPFFNRVAEHAQKLALVVAVGIDPSAPVLDRHCMAFGRAVAELCTRSTLAEISGRLADNDRQREHIDVKRWIEEAGEGGLTRTQISKRVNGRFDRRRLDDILQSLESDSKEVSTLLFQSPRGGPKGARFVSRKFLDEGSAA